LQLSAAPGAAYFKFWLNKIEYRSTTAQMAANQPKATSTIIGTLPCLFRF
jgi:hypothetical protein